MRTKAEILTAKRDFLAHALDMAQREIDGLKETEFAPHNPDARNCSGCGEEILTEWDFAKHFVVPNEQFLNLGECPNRSARTPRGVMSIRYELIAKVI